MKKDTLFTELAESHSFVFNKAVADVFDDMIRRSVPGYLIQQYFMAENIAALIAHNNANSQHTLLLDLGCSTGATIESISTMVKEKNISTLESSIIGCDYSADMLAIGRKKMTLFQPLWNSIEMVQVDIGNLQVLQEVFSRVHTDNDKCVDVIILHFILQFIPINVRKDIIMQCWEYLTPHGMLFVGEKVRSSDPHIQTMWEQMQFQFKRSQGYSEMQINSKNRALEGVLVSEDSHVLQNILSALPYSNVELYFAHGEFQCYIVRKYKS